MARENVETVHRALDAFNREDLRVLAELSDDDLEFISLFSALDSGGATYRGPESWADYFAAMKETWADWQVEDFRVVDAGEDRVASLFRLVGTGRRSGVPVERPGGMAYWFRGGKIWRLRSYVEPTDALDAVGLSE